MDVSPGMAKLIMQHGLAVGMIAAGLTIFIDTTVWLYYTRD